MRRQTPNPPRRVTPFFLSRAVCASGLALLLAGCGGSGLNAPATLQTDLTAYAVQATEIRVTGQAVTTQAVATIAAAQTQAAYFEAYNQVLVATVRAGETAPPPQIAISQGQLDGSLGVAPPMEFLQVNMSDRINAGDRCALTDVTLFDVAQTPRLYLSAVVTNILQGTRFEVIWQHDGQQVHRTAWTATETSANQCLAMELAADNTPFLAGEWNAILIADQRVIQTVPFAMIEQTTP